MIKAAAIKTSDGEIISLPRPLRHHDILGYMQQHSIPYTTGAVQGFITHTDLFLTREEAYWVAHKAGQLLFRDGQTHCVGRLYTEDMW